MTRRTTVSADADDLAVLQSVARRRGVSLAVVLREAVEREAARLRTESRPRFGLFDSGGAGAAEQSWRDEDAPAAGRRRS